MLNDYYYYLLPLLNISNFVYIFLLPLLNTSGFLFNVVRFCLIFLRFYRIFRGFVYLYSVSGALSNIPRLSFAGQSAPKIPGPTAVAIMENLRTTHPKGGTTGE